MAHVNLNTANSLPTTSNTTVEDGMPAVQPPDYDPLRPNYLVHQYNPVYIPSQYSAYSYKDVLRNSPFKCDKCSAVFMLEMFFQLHKEKHIQAEREQAQEDNNHPAPPKDDIQKKSSEEGGNEMKAKRKRLKPHLSIKCLPLYCVKCQYYAVTIDDLVSHMAQHGESKIDHRCGNCDYRTINRGNFKRHVMTHGNVRPFKCNFCPFTASQKTHLGKHLQYHIGDRDYKCDMCSYNCSDKANYNKHKKIHMETEPVAVNVVKQEMLSDAQYDSHGPL